MSKPQPLSPLDRKITFSGALLSTAIALTFIVALLPVFGVALPGSASYMPLLAWTLYALVFLTRMWLRL